MSPIKIYQRLKILLILFVVSFSSAQLYIPADPFDLIFIEKKIMMGGDDIGSLMIRPIVFPHEQNTNRWSLKFRSDGMCV